MLPEVSMSELFVPGVMAVFSPHVVVMMLTLLRKKCLIF